MIRLMPQQVKAATLSFTSLQQVDSFIVFNSPPSRMAAPLLPHARQFNSTQSSVFAYNINLQPLTTNHMLNNSYVMQLNSKLYQYRSSGLFAILILSLNNDDIKKEFIRSLQSWIHSGLMHTLYGMSILPTISSRDFISLTSFIHRFTQ